METLKECVERAVADGLSSDQVLARAREYMTQAAAPCLDQAVGAPEVDHFLLSREWVAVRMVALERDGGRCACCGRTSGDGITINVDHIKPRRRYPELALTADNLQVLCNECNQGKGNRFQTDWRRKPSTTHADV